MVDSIDRILHQGIHLIRHHHSHTDYDLFNLFSMRPNNQNAIHCRTMLLINQCVQASVSVQAGV